MTRHLSKMLRASRSLQQIWLACCCYPRWSIGVAFSFERLKHSPLHTTRLEMLFTRRLFFAVGYVQWVYVGPSGVVEMGPEACAF